MGSLASTSSPPTGVEPDPFDPSQRFLYRWQLDALTAWLECGRRGVVEAVTGSGKTNVAMAAIIDARRRGLFVLVVVPSRVLIEQWYERLSETIPEAKLGRLGDNYSDKPANCDILITTRHSAASHRPSPPTDAGGLLVADEVHGFGGGVLRKALRPDYQERLGLTATLERSDDAVEKILLPFFGGVCFRYGFIDAIADGVCAQPRVAFVSVPLNKEERDDYIAIEERLVSARSTLRRIPDMPLAPFGAFLAAVNHLAANDAGPQGRAANDYLKSFSQRRDIVASSTAKYEALGTFSASIEAADGALIFTETVRAANHAVNRLDTDIDIEVITGGTPKREREDILTNLRTRQLDAVAAPRVLDEGVDVPNANLGIVVSASRTRRQMIQRMGRILRRKAVGVGARFVIIFARDTLEDPTTRDDRDGFLDEIEAIADSSRVFRVDPTSDPDDDDAATAARLGRFLDYSGPDKVVDPVQLGPIPTGAGTAGTTTSADLDDELFDRLSIGDTDAWSSLSALSTPAAKAAASDLWDGLGGPRLYATMSYLAWGDTTNLHEIVWSRYADEPQVTEAELLPYLAIEEIELPEIAKPKPQKKLLSTGEKPVVITQIGKEWAVRCTGCGAVSESTPFKWQALDQTVECTCEDW